MQPEAGSQQESLVGEESSDSPAGQGYREVRGDQQPTAPAVGARDSSGGAPVVGQAAEDAVVKEVLGGRSSRVRHVVALGGGKGGIGKSFISANLGVHLAQLGQKVVLVDADLGGANLHTCLGMAPPKRTLSDFVNRIYDGLADVVTPTTVPRLGLVSGALDYFEAANPKFTQKVRLLREITRLDADSVIIDLGAGTGPNIVDFFLIAERGVLAVVPEPTSIENAYRFIKTAYYRRLKTLELSWNMSPLVEQAMSATATRGLRTPAELVAYVEKRDARAGARLRAELERFPLYLIVNQTRNGEEERLGQAMGAACRRHFGVALEFLGAIPYDDAVWRAVRRRRPLLLDSPNSNASQAIRRLAAGLGLEG